MKLNNMIKNQKTRTYRSISEFLFRLWAVSVMAVSFSLFAFGALSLTYVIIPLIVQQISVSPESP
jgi:hypothetical protein